jgi:hypothetical protein
MAGRVLLRKSPPWRGGAERRGGSRSLLHNPPQGLTALAPPRRGFDRHFPSHIAPSAPAAWQPLRKASSGKLLASLAVPCFGSRRYEVARYDEGLEFESSIAQLSSFPLSRERRHVATACDPNILVPYEFLEQSKRILRYLRLATLDTSPQPELILIHNK